MVWEEVTGYSVRNSMWEYGIRRCGIRDKARGCVVRDNTVRRFLWGEGGGEQSSSAGVVKWGQQM